MERRPENRNRFESFGASGSLIGRVSMQPRQLDLPRFCSGHLIAKNAIKEDEHGIETQRGIST